MSSALESQVLVLNKNYTPIGLTNAKDAFIKLFGSVAEVITVEDGTYCNHDFSSWSELSAMKQEFEDLREKHDEFINTPSLTLEVPRVIRVLEYDKIPLHSIKLTRRNVYARDNNTCQYCGKRFKTDKLNLDHVIPRSKGGKNTWENLVCSCHKCNAKKGDKTLKEAGLKLIRKPFKPKENPTLRVHIGNAKYKSWKNFVSEVYWTVEISD
jgi:5-methylcytosine-specific restriction endonuclease McrA